jgi:hypothetical protein
MPTKTQDIGLTRAQLIKVVRTDGEIKGVAKMRALASLQNRPRKDAADVLMEVLADRQEAPRFRHMAAVGLYRLGGASADEALARASRRADEVSAPAIAMGLGRIGSSKRLAMIERLEAVAAPPAKARVAFAATLLAYRHRLPGHDVRAPGGNALQQLGRRKSQPIEAAKARADLAARAAAALEQTPLGVDLATENAVRIVCGPSTFVWLWARELATTGFAALAEQKGVAGVLFRKSPVENAYSLSAVGLGTPTRAGVRLTVHRADSGKMLYSGLVAPDGALELLARNQPGLAAVAVKARVEAGRVAVTTAKSAVIVREARTPKRA